MTYVENDPQAVFEALTALIAPGDVFEIRALHPTGWRGMQGYFNDPQIASEAIEDLGDDEYAGIYVTLNPLEPDVLYRSNNRLVRWKKELGAKDHEVLARRWLPIDIDPIRTSGISSTDDEHIASLKLARDIASTLELNYGFPEPIMASSGNGAHLLYPIEFANDEGAKNEIKEFIRYLSLTYSNSQCKIDTSVFNASRIWRLYGTVSRKGSNSKERPHRISQLLSVPDEYVPVPRSLLRKISRVDFAVPSKSKAKPYPADEQRWRELNREALLRLDDWVPLAFGDDAREYQNGYRISSEALGRDREEDLSIQPLPIGILDFGEHDSGEQEEGHRTAISVLAEWLFNDIKEDAAKFLSDALGVDESAFKQVASKYASFAKDDDSEDFLEKKQKDDGKPRVHGFDISVLESVSDVYDAEIPELKYLVEGLLPVGVYCLISRPKMGKSWLALQLALAVSNGKSFLGHVAEKKHVLMFNFEERRWRFNLRLKRLNVTREDTLNMHSVCLDQLEQNPWPRGEAGCDVIRQYLDNIGNVGLIVLDTFTLFRDHEAADGGSVYDRDYASVMPLIRLANAYGISILCVHHERKGATVVGKQTDADFMEAANGSSGLSAAFEGMLRIEGLRTESPEDEDQDEKDPEKPHEPKAPRKLKISGRDIEQDVITRNIAFDHSKGGWHRTGKIDVEKTLIASLRGCIQLTISELQLMHPTIPKTEIKRTLNQLLEDDVISRTNYSYSLLNAGESSDFPKETFKRCTTLREKVLKAIEWRGTSSMSFVYEVINDYSPTSIRSMLVTLCNKKLLIRSGHGVYKLSKTGVTEAKKVGMSEIDVDDLL